LDISESRRWFLFNEVLSLKVDHGLSKLLITLSEGRVDLVGGLLVAIWVKVVLPMSILIISNAVHVD
jgi:hypothetical protein